MKPLISIIIVNYNTRELLRNCLESIRSCLDTGYEVIVADNGSSDNSLALCEDFRSDGRFRFIDMGGNLGFAKANNRAASEASGKVFHFLNPDTEMPQGMSEDYKHALAAPDAVYVNPLTNRDGSLENGRMPIPSLGNLILWDLHSSKAKYWFRGASVIISAENFRRVGGWCEDYFLYSEDLELFWQCWKHGIAIKPLPTEIFHFGGGSSRNTWDNLGREIMVQKSTRIFFRRNFPGGYFWSRLYLLAHVLLKHPSAAKTFIRAWRLSSQA